MSLTIPSENAYRADLKRVAPPDYPDSAAAPPDTGPNGGRKRQKTARSKLVEVVRLIESLIEAFPANATSSNQDLFRSLYLETKGDGAPTIEKIEAIVDALASGGFGFPATVKNWKPLLYYIQHFAWLYYPVRGSKKTKHRLYVGKVISALGHAQDVWAEISGGNSWTLKMYVSLHETRRDGKSALWAWKRGDRQCMTWYWPLQKLFRLGDLDKMDFGNEWEDDYGRKHVPVSKNFTRIGKWDNHQNDHIKAVILLIHAFPGLIMKKLLASPNTVHQIFKDFAKFPFLESVITPGIPLNGKKLTDLPAISEGLPSSGNNEVQAAAITSRQPSSDDSDPGLEAASSVNSVDPNTTADQPKPLADPPSISDTLPSIGNNVVEAASAVDSVDLNPTAGQNLDLTPASVPTLVPLGYRGLKPMSASDRAMWPPHYTVGHLGERGLTPLSDSERAMWPAHYTVGHLGDRPPIGSRR
ncbi:hypothetical protein D6D01_04583 [Aureobasidium pullulans]|uniref:Uncharacterized protein n=1 Tax=Aureobasidium pullulans TaxID=5580 RepID=A0A4S9L9Z7_AURPU|nr:hypothetical protein D6D01_04583 [Aureobasidium pullulans]